MPPTFEQGAGFVLIEDMDGLFKTQAKLFVPGTDAMPTLHFNGHPLDTPFRQPREPWDQSRLSKHTAPELLNLILQKRKLQEEREAEEKPKPKEGWCEICKNTYADLDHHVKTNAFHRSFARSKANYAKIDKEFSDLEFEFLSRHQLEEPQYHMLSRSQRERLGIEEHQVPPQFRLSLVPPTSSSSLQDLDPFESLSDAPYYYSQGNMSGDSGTTSRSGFMFEDADGELANVSARPMIEGMLPHRSNSVLSQMSQQSNASGYHQQYARVSSRAAKIVKESQAAAGSSQSSSQTPLAGASYDRKRPFSAFSSQQQDGDDSGLVANSLRSLAQPPPLTSYPMPRPTKEDMLVTPLPRPHGISLPDPEQVLGQEVLAPSRAKRQCLATPRAVDPTPSLDKENISLMGTGKGNLSVTVVNARKRGLPLTVTPSRTGSGKKKEGSGHHAPAPNPLPVSALGPLDSDNEHIDDDDEKSGPVGGFDPDAVIAQTTKLLDG
jgi:hypothetical protein